MKLKTIALATSMIACFAVPSLSHSAESSLHGWGKAFGEAYTKAHGMSFEGTGNAAAEGMLKVNTPQAKAPEAPKPGLADKGKEAGAQASAEGRAKAEAGAHAAMDFTAEHKTAALDKVDSTYAMAGTALDTLSTKATATVDKLGSTLAQGVSLNHQSQMNQQFNVAGMVTGSLAASTTASAQLAGVSQAAALSAVSASAIHSMMAARPTGLTGMLR